jgi:hypothetical protein
MAVELPRVYAEQNASSRRNGYGLDFFAPAVTANCNFPPFPQDGLLPFVGNEVGHSYKGIDDKRTTKFIRLADGSKQALARVAGLRANPNLREPNPFLRRGEPETA